MATIRAYIRTSKKKADSVNIRFRLSAGKVQLYHVSDITVNPEQWDDVRQEIKARVLVPDTYRKEISAGVATRKNILMGVYGAIKDDPTPERWYEEIDKRLNPEKQPKEKTFFDIFDEYIDVQTKSLKPHLRVLRRCLRRWEMYMQFGANKSFSIDLNSLSGKDVSDFEEFLRCEYSIQDKFPEIYKAVPETRRVAPRGNNSLANILGRLRGFHKWAVKTKLTANNPFDEYNVPQEVYGTPYYISIEERDKLLHADLSEHPETAIQRDIFVFQCLIGCRVSDLSKFTKINLRDDGAFIEYIPKKTKEDHPVTVRVPLAETAKELIKKYDGVDKRGRLFPFISDQKYNIQIKKAFTLAGLNRLVTVLDPTTGEEEQRPLNEVASSHMARRAFVGNLYKKVKDPNLIASMSGHVEGSRAFARYRTIDDDMKKETIKFLEE